MPQQTITVTLDVPDGWELTGEYRCSKPGEHLLSNRDAYEYTMPVPSSNPCFILRPKPPEKRKRWVNVYPGNVVSNMYDSKEAADAGAAHYETRIACIPLEYQVPPPKG